MYGTIVEFGNRVGRFLSNWRSFLFFLSFIMQQISILAVAGSVYFRSKEMKGASTLFGPGNVTNMVPRRLIWYDPMDDPPNDCFTSSVEDWKTKEWLCLNGTQYPSYDQLHMVKTYFECRERRDDCEHYLRDSRMKICVSIVAFASILLFIATIVPFFFYFGNWNNEEGPGGKRDGKKEKSLRKPLLDNPAVV